MSGIRCKIAYCKNNNKIGGLFIGNIREMWQRDLAKDDLGHYWSSARFYENAVDDFGFLSNLYTVFDGE